MRQEIPRFSIELYPTGIQRLPHQRKKCVDDGDFVEDNVNSVKDVLEMYAHFIVTVIAEYDKTIRGTTFVPTFV